MLSARSCGVDGWCSLFRLRVGGGWCNEGGGEVKWALSVLSVEVECCC